MYMLQYINGTFLKYCNIIIEFFSRLVKRKFTFLFVLVSFLLLMVLVNLDFFDKFFDFGVFKTVFLSICVFVFFIV